MTDSIVSSVISSARSSGRTVLTEIESKRILHSLGLPVAVPEAALTADDAVRAASRMGFPVALKVLSPDVTHKSQVGGVELNLDNEGAVRDAFERIRRNLAARGGGARFEGVAVGQMAKQGVELLAGTYRDDRFGAMVMVGLGGVFVEVMKDTELALAPIGGREAASMLARLRGAQIIRGVRGQPGVDIDAVVSILETISGIAATHPEIAEMDLNPVAAYEDGLAILDARIVLAAPASEPPAPDPHRAARLKNLERAFNPRVVAVIGDKRMSGYMWIRAMAHLKGKLYSVQIDPNEIPGIEAMGVENRKSLAEITEPIDYAVSAVPRQIAPRILKDCVAKQVAAVGFFTSGFSETSEELGIRLEAELREIAINSEIALVGPNCMGLYSPGAGLCNFPEEKAGEAGDVCFISQSGTHTINFCLQAPTHGIKVNKAASIGNALVLEAADYIDLMAADPATRAIGMYIEGVRDGRRFFDSVRHAAERHPVVVWKGGVTEAGARATFSHTGSLATAEATWRTVVRQSGAVEVASLDAMLDAVELFARAKRIGGRGMGLVAMTGGQSVVITDTFATAGLEIPALSESSYDELKTFFNIIGGSYRNPLDVGGTIGAGHDQGNLDRILEILERDPVIDAIVLEVGTGLRAARWATHEDEIAGLLDKLADFAGRSTKPFAVVMHPAHLEAIVARGKELARARGLVVFESFERAAATFRAAADYWGNRARLGS
ncbi:acetate--CoA ligase family protein [Candidatus Binatus sp.]|uniref:acetate--CoA ligase family protein n=1 Tax=Candidatus Binatus sp. TaxID=2811406 RepID=UPI003C3B7923